jgi:hypothetical protein
MKMSLNEFPSLSNEQLDALAHVSDSFGAIASWSGMEKSGQLFMESLIFALGDIQANEVKRRAPKFSELLAEGDDLAHAVPVDTTIATMGLQGRPVQRPRHYPIPQSEVDRLSKMVIGSR